MVAHCPPCFFLVCSCWRGLSFISLVASLFCSECVALDIPDWCSYHAKKSVNLLCSSRLLQPFHFFHSSGLLLVRSPIGKREDRDFTKVGTVSVERLFSCSSVAFCTLWLRKLSVFCKVVGLRYKSSRGLLPSVLVIWLFSFSLVSFPSQFNEHFHRRLGKWFSTRLKPTYRSYVWRCMSIVLVGSLPSFTVFDLNAVSECTGDFAI